MHQQLCLLLVSSSQSGVASEYRIGAAIRFSGNVIPGLLEFFDPHSLPPEAIAVALISRIAEVTGPNTGFISWRCQLAGKSFRKNPAATRLAPDGLPTATRDGIAVQNLDATVRRSEQRNGHPTVRQISTRI